APRLVLADWLEDHADADRAEFVRLSVRLSAGEIPLGDEAVSLARLHELYSRNADRWLGGLRHWDGRVTFRPGLIEAPWELGPLRELQAIAPPDAPPWLETLDFRYGQQKWIGDLVDSDVVRHFSGLELTSVRFTTPWLRRLGGGPHTPRLRR